MNAFSLPSDQIEKLAWDLLSAPGRRIVACASVAARIVEKGEVTAADWRECFGNSVDSRVAKAAGVDFGPEFSKSLPVETITVALRLAGALGFPGAFTSWPPAGKARREATTIMASDLPYDIALSAPRACYDGRVIDRLFDAGGRFVGLIVTPKGAAAAMRRAA